MKVLAPGMEHRQKPDAGAKVFGVGGDLQQGFGGGAEEQAIHQALVLQCQRCEQLGQCEHHVEVLNR